ncbi:undecaprenyl-diphosphate phosphatase [candidate division WOR-3 bacterium]|nr:undecaprenyl-diphosphate phosphatase [candidate division WOR-3 bacterium]
MTLVKALLLGAVQGFTEILPVSSDGHLAVVQELLRTGPDWRLALTAVLHLGTGLALVVFFFPRLGSLTRAALGADPRQRSEGRALFGRLALATVPAVAAGLLLEDHLAGLTTRMPVVAACLAANGLWLLLSGLGRDRGRGIGLAYAVLIGVAQVAALLPGVSRSGTTICFALLLGVPGLTAFEFSFLLAIPATLGAGAYALARHWSELPGPGFVLAGLAAAFVFGLCGLWLLRSLVRRGRLVWFGVYCLSAAAALALLRR